MEVVMDFVRGEGSAVGKPFPLWPARGADAVQDSVLGQLRA